MWIFSLFNYSTPLKMFCKREHNRSRKGVTAGSTSLFGWKGGMQPVNRLHSGEKVGVEEIRV